MTLHQSVSHRQLQPPLLEEGGIHQRTRHLDAVKRRTKPSSRWMNDVEEDDERSTKQVIIDKL